ncbi:FecR family protein [Marinoscillum furvescens]|nr:FecR domain-containing protein [Marinoscillum furvescens]
MNKNWTDNYHQQANGNTHPDKDYETFQELTAYDCPVNIEKAWKKVDAKLKPASVWPKVFRIAAMLVLAIGLAWVTYENVYNSANELEIVASKDGEILTLPDQSTITLAANAKVSYPETFDETRAIFLTGEAFFAVTKSDKPFIVTTKQGKIEVLGTQFNVKSGKTLDVMVSSGKVSVSSGESQTELIAGERALANGNEVRKFYTYNPNALAWRTGHFKFSNEHLKQALPQLERYYKVKFTSSKSILNCKVTAKFENASFDEVLTTLQSILQVKAKKKGDLIKLSGRGCN